MSMNPLVPAVVGQAFAILLMGVSGFKLWRKNRSLESCLDSAGAAVDEIGAELQALTERQAPLVRCLQEEVERLKERVLQTALDAEAGLVDETWAFAAYEGLVERGGDVHPQEEYVSYGRRAGTYLVHDPELAAMLREHERSTTSNG